MANSDPFYSPRRKKVNKPRECSACGIEVVEYKRKYNAEMALWLIWLVRRWERDRTWIYAPDYPSAGGDYAKNRPYGLAIIKPKSPDQLGTRTSGMWIPHERGISFVYREITIPSHVFLIKGSDRATGFEETETTIEEALKKSFNYTELMNDSRWGGADYEEIFKSLLNRG